MKTAIVVEGDPARDPCLGLAAVGIALGIGRRSSNSHVKQREMCPRILAARSTRALRRRQRLGSPRDLQKEHRRDEEGECEDGAAPYGRKLAINGYRGVTTMTD